MTELPVASPWFAVSDAGDGVTLLTEPHVHELIGSNVWHVRGRDRDLVVDTANGLADLAAEVGSLAAGRPVIAVTTHGHFDHVGGLAGFADRRCHAADADATRTPYPMRIRREDFPADAGEMFAFYGYDTPELLVSAVPSAAFDPTAWVSPGAEPTAFVADGDVLDLGDRALEVLHVPGHTPGSVALWEEATRVLFTGDMLYADGRLSFDDPVATRSSLARLRELPADRMLAGHDRIVDGPKMRALIDRELAALEG